MTTTDIQPKDLTTKAMLVSLNIKAWNVNRKDKQATASITNEYQNESGWARGNKTIAASKELTEVSKILLDCRNFHNTYTSPWNDEGGQRILAAKNYMFYTEAIRKFSNELETALVILKAAYPAIKERAKEALKGLYNEADYPTVEDITNKFKITVQVCPVPSSNDFRVTQITNEDFKAIQAQIENQVRDANKNIINDLWDRLYSVVNKAAEAFNDPDMKFKDSKIDNISETIVILRKLNFDNDTKLERMLKAVEAKICNLDPHELRKEPTARQEAANTTKALLDAMSGYC